MAGRPTQRGDPVYDRASADSLAQLPGARLAIFVVRELDGDAAALTAPGLTSWNGVLATNVPFQGSLRAGAGELSPSDPSTIARATLRTFLLFLLMGAGWAWWAFGRSCRDAAGALALAPAFGSALLTLVALALERLGADLDRGWVAALACGVAGGIGYALLVVRLAGERRHGGRKDSIVQRPTGSDA